MSHIINGVCQLCDHATDDCTCSLSFVERIEEARERGTAAGTARAQNGGEAGDWLSGEWAGESITELLGDLLEGTDEDEQDELCDEYEEAADAAYATEAYTTAVENDYRTFTCKCDDVEFPDVDSCERCED